MSTYNTTIEIESTDGFGDFDYTMVPIVVRYESHRAIAGATDGRGGLKIEPDEPAHLEIESVTLPNGRKYELSPTQRSKLEEEICDWLSGHYDEDPPDRDYDN